MMIVRRSHSYISIGAAVLLLLIPVYTHAATLSLTPAYGSVETGTSITEAVVVSSPDQALNAVSGTLTFAPDTLQVLSVSKASSIVSLWVTEPTFSNVDGTITFSGIVPNPGYIGSRGQLFTISFRSKRAGIAVVPFSSSQVLANDGNGTNILTGTQPARITVTTPAPQPTPEPTPVPAPSSPVVATTSEPSAPAELVIPPPTIVEEVSATTALPWSLVLRGWLAVNYLSLVLVVVAVLGTLAFAAWYIHVHFFAYRRRLHHRLGLTHSHVHREFDKLKEALTEELHGLEHAKSKRSLTREEEKMLARFKKLLEQAEIEIEKEIEDTPT